MDNPLSIVPSERTSNEFPVLKAFQDYIDAEQAKARKRMLGLSVFFIVLLFVVVVTFVLILTTVLNRNQALSDRLLDYALRERDKTQIVQQIPPSPQPSVDIMKTMVERMEKEQAEMKAAFERQRKEAERVALEKERVNEEKMKLIQAELARERQKAKKDAEKKAEVEKHRRRLYPDYYRMESDAELPIPPPASSFKKQKIKLAESPSSRQVQSEKQNPQPAKASALSELKPVTYFNVDDNDSVPFLLETPQQNK